MITIDFLFGRGNLTNPYLDSLVTQRCQLHYYYGKNLSNKTANRNYRFLLEVVFTGHDNNVSSFGDFTRSCANHIPRVSFTWKENIEIDYSYSIHRSLLCMK